jgi:FKBP-type peptidyl-prolyl cis-trans isomerase SlyD
MINNKDMIELDLIIKDNDTKELLDTTLEAVAKKENLYDSKITYESLKVVFGKGELLVKVEENIKDLKKGESKTFALDSKDAFGSKDNKNIKLIPMSDFKNEKIKPVSGMHITYNNQTGKVLSVSGGRVQVDFNHDFAGRNLEYTVTVKDIYTDNKSKLTTLVEKYFYFLPSEELKLNINDKEAEIILPQMLPKEIEYFKYSFVQLALDICDFENIKFSQIFTKNDKIKK